MKNQIVILFILFGLLLSSTFSIAQDYKHPYGLVSKEGKITDPKGTVIGSITKDGTIKDESGNKIATVNSTGNLVDTKTGKVLGHAPKNGEFIYFNHNGTQNDTLSTSIPMTGTCEVKDKDGKTVLVVHENYKAYGACAYHCLMMKKHGKKMKMKM